MPLRAITHHTAVRGAGGAHAAGGRGCAGAALTCLEWNRAKFEPGYVFYAPNMAQDSPGYAALPLRATAQHSPHTAANRRHRPVTKACDVPSARGDRVGVAQPLLLLGQCGHGGARGALRLIVRSPQRRVLVHVRHLHILKAGAKSQCGAECVRIHVFVVI